ncbi:RidA family protein [Rhodococcus koreensis]
MTMDTNTIEIRKAPFTWAENAEYSQAVRVGETVYTAGQGGFDDSGELVAGGFVEQTRQTFRNIEAALRSHGADLHGLQGGAARVLSGAVACLDGRLVCPPRSLDADRDRGNRRRAEPPHSPRGLTCNFLALGR